MSSDSARGRCRVFVTRPLPGPALQELAQEHLIRVWDGVGIPTDEDVLKGARRAQGLLCLLTDRVDGHLLDACPGLRVISSCSVGVDHVDLAAACQRGIPVGHTPGVLTETTADLAFGLLLAAARRIPEADRFVREGLWTWERRWEPDLLLGRDLHGSTLGIVGLGAIGQAVARRALGFGMQVLGWSRSEGLTPGVERVSRLEELLGGMCRAGFVIEDLVEPLHAQADGPPGEFAHRSHYLPAYLRVKARRQPRSAGLSSAGLWTPPK